MLSISKHDSRLPHNPINARCFAANITILHLDMQASFELPSVIPYGDSTIQMMSCFAANITIFHLNM